MGIEIAVLHLLIERRPITPYFIHNATVLFNLPVINTNRSFLLQPQG